ncbi:MAG: LacI family DNA-binding transcriptional regulator [Rhizobiales bacterium]|nr:LacI family transcriptional regulator [Hyphomicrobiales bacterium]NRB13198.1 LacI family DNA-binding transcriptional regulator [Hyphomicrobiales bacterium]
MAVTIKEVALRAQVSRSAVSRTFTDGASVSTKMRKKVIKAANELGYAPNILARSLTTRRTKLIGLVSNNFDNPFFLKVFDLFTSGLQDVGLRPLLVNLTSETDPAQAAHMLRQYSVDGVIVASSELPAIFSKAFKEVNIPIIESFGMISEDTSDMHCVSIDNKQCGRMAARLLIKKGYTNIGFMGGPENVSVSRGRFEGFKEVLKSHPEIQASYSYAESHTFAAGRKEMLRLLKSPTAQAYYCGDDVISIGAISAIQSTGLSVPEDIGIMGLDDIEIAGWENINLTTIHQPIQQIISSTIELMEAILEEPDRYPENRLFPCYVVERGTLKNQ